jgi:hypothetical protein
VTLRPRASRIAANEADAMPFPNEETTPPVTKIKRVIQDPGTGEMCKITERKFLYKMALHYTDFGPYGQMKLVSNG